MKVERDDLVPLIGRIAAHDRGEPASPPHKEWDDRKGSENGRAAAWVCQGGGHGVHGTTPYPEAFEPANIRFPPVGWVTSAIVTVTGFGELEYFVDLDILRLR